MASIVFPRETPIDQTLEAIGAAAGAKQRPIRCRLQPDLYDWEKTSYTAWHTLAWTVEIEDVAEGRRLRKGLTAFFRAFGGDAAGQKRLLVELERLAGGK